MKRCETVHYCHDTDVLYIGMIKELSLVKRDDGFMPLHICEMYTADGQRSGYEILDFKREYDKGSFEGFELEGCDFQSDVIPRALVLIENGVDFEDELQ